MRYAMKDGVRWMEALCAVMVAFTAGCGDGAHAGSDKAQIGTSTSRGAERPPAPPLRVVRTGHGDVPTMRKEIEQKIKSCLEVETRLPRTPVSAPQVPPDHVLTDLVVYEDEKLFHGRLRADYHVFRSIVPDEDNGCQPRVMIDRFVFIENADGRLEGQSLAVVVLIHEKGIVKAPDNGKVIERKRDPGERAQFGQRVEESNDYKSWMTEISKLPTEDAGAGQGVRCFWFSLLLKSTLAKLQPAAGLAQSASQPPDGKEVDGLDYCVYDKHPSYHGELVTLKTKPYVLPPEQISQAGFLNPQLERMSDGVPIPPSRFSRETAQTFLSQRSTAPVGESRP